MTFILELTCKVIVALNAYCANATATVSTNPSRNDTLPNA